MKTPASRKRAVSTSSGGQLATATLATENADAQSRQNEATSSGKGNLAEWAKPAEMTGLRCAWVTFLSVTHMGLRLVIQKLNDHIIASGILNGCHMLDLDLLRSFVSVVDTGGFTRAGERVHRTQSTVSQQIRRLEESLGYPLLHR